MKRVVAPSKLLSTPIYPLLIAALPLLHYYEKDFGSATLWQLVRLTFVYWLVTGGLWVALQRLLRDSAKGALVCGAVSAPLFYGGSLELPALLGVLAIVALVVLGVVRLRIAWASWTPVVNAVCIVFVAFPVIATLRAEWTSRPPRPVAGYAEPLRLLAGEDNARPDIYYILADGLAHPAILQSMYAVSRDDFETPLRSLGFHIVPGSRSNYAQTALSLSSTLNMAYVQDLLEFPDTRSDDRRPLAGLIARNRVVNTLRASGYRIITLPSEYDLAQLDGVDVRHKPLLAPGFFELHTVRNTILPYVQRALGRGPADLEFALHRRRVEFVLDRLPRVRKDIAASAPVFVYAHIIAPHPPFVYGRNGEHLRSRQRFGFSDGDHWLMERHGVREEYVREYRNQALYIVEEVARSVEAIIRSSPRPVVIVVQGDHGPGSELRWDNIQLTNKVERHGIFNAWFASNPPASPPPGLTAVNTFPFLFNTYLGTSLPLLEDRVWYSRWILPYEFSELPRMR